MSIYILKMKMWLRNDAHLKHGEKICATQGHIHPWVVALSRRGQGGLQLRDSHLLCTCYLVNGPNDSPSAQLGVSGSQGEGTLVPVQCCALYEDLWEVGRLLVAGWFSILSDDLMGSSIVWEGIDIMLIFFRGCGWSMSAFMQWIN